MKPCKRIEIVIEAPLVEQLIKQLKAVGTPGYTVLQDARGEGDRGVRRGNELTGDSSNCVILIACEDDGTVEKILEAARPLLTRSGGICLVSDANWLRH